MGLIKSLIKLSQDKTILIDKLLYTFNGGIEEQLKLVLDNGYTIEDYLKYLKHNDFYYNLKENIEWFKKLKEKSNLSWEELFSKISSVVEVKDIPELLNIISPEDFEKVYIEGSPNGNTIDLLNLYKNTKSEKVKELILIKNKDVDKFIRLIKNSLLTGSGLFIDEFIKYITGESISFAKFGLILSEEDIFNKNSDDVLYKIYGNKDIQKICSNYTFDIFYKLYRSGLDFFKKYEDLLEIYTYIYTKLAISKSNLPNLSKQNLFFDLGRVNNLKPAINGISKAILDSKNIPLEIFDYLKDADISLVNQIFQKSQKNLQPLKRLKYDIGDYVFIKNLYEMNNNLLKIIISNCIDKNNESILSDANKLIMNYIATYGKDINSVYHDYLKQNPYNFKKIMDFLSVLFYNYDEFNMIGKEINFPKVQNFSQYMKLKIRQLDLAKLEHNEHIENKEIINLLFNNIKLDLTEDYSDNLIEVLNLLNNENDNINKFLQLSEQFKQKGFTLDIEKFVQNINLAKSYVEQLNQFKLNPDSRFVRTMKELTTDFSYVEMFDLVKQYMRDAKPKNEKLFKLNASFDGIEFSVLKDLDPLHFRIGIETDCCQRIGGVGEEAAVDSFINPNAGVLVATKDGKILSQSYFHYVPNDNGFILDNVEYNEDEVKKYGPINNEQSLWLAEVYKKYGEIIKNNNPDIKYIKIGSGYSKIPLNEFEKDSMEEDPRDFAVDEPYSDFDEEDHYNLFKR